MVTIMSLVFMKCEKTSANKRLRCGWTLQQSAVDDGFVEKFNAAIAGVNGEWEDDETE